MARAVLVVEDDPFVRTCTAEMVAECGFDVLEAPDAHSAIEVLQAESDHIAVVVTDVRMPGPMDGVDLANLVVKAWPNIRVLVTTGFDDGRLGHLAGGIKFLPKPWRALDVISYVMKNSEDPGSDPDTN